MVGSLFVSYWSCPLAGVEHGFLWSGKAFIHLLSSLQNSVDLSHGLFRLTFSSSLRVYAFFVKSFTVKGWGLEKEQRLTCVQQPG